MRARGSATDLAIITADRTCRAYLETDETGHTWVSEVEGVGTPVVLPDSTLDALTGFAHVFAKGLVDCSSAIARLRDAGVRTSYDYSFFDDDLGEYAADLTFYSAGEGNADRGRRFAARAIERGARIAIATLGADGCIALTSEGDEYRIAPEPVRVVDSIGAGDAFTAGFIAAAARGATLEESLHAAAARGAEACLLPLAFEQETWPVDVGDRPLGIKTKTKTN
ncbi:hypothetical protein D1J51_12800 [Leucobacter sp. wl10]|nr:hypothetical protein D1J51_12800 [Leucobacter sp. wl10]